MSRLAPFHSLNESRKGDPRYHTDSACDQAREILRDDRRDGSGGFFQCKQCAALHVQPAAVGE